MKRDVHALADREFDVLVIGGGILGSCTARDAAARGLSVALVEAGDFASATSANSLKIIHGGLRYLQQLDVRRVRESVRERSMWLYAAPHLVEPFPVLVPTFRSGLQRKALLRLALQVNDLVSWDRNARLAADRRIPGGRALSREETFELVPELIGDDNLTGGVIFHDAQIYNSERLVLEVLQSAMRNGAIAANYTTMSAPLRINGKLIGAKVTDTLEGVSMDVRARVLVNAAGAGALSVAKLLSNGRGSLQSEFATALNVMLDSRRNPVAVAVRGQSEDPDALMSLGSRQFFMVPWRDRLVVGTGHYRHSGRPEEFALDPADTARFLAEVNGAWPGPSFDIEDVLLVHRGLIPVASAGPYMPVRFLKRHRIVDHAEDGVPNALTAITGKYTTARLAAEEAVDLVGEKLGVGLGRNPTRWARLPGAPTEGVENLLTRARHRHHGSVDEDVLDHLVRSYGESYERVLAYRATVSDWDSRPLPGEPVIKAQWIHGIRAEMAVRPEDLVWRRTELGARGLASHDLLEAAARALKEESIPA